MSLRDAAARLRSLSPFLLVGMLSCAGCEDPWPDASPPIRASYLTVVPNELYIHVADPTLDERANIIAFVQDEYGRNLDDHTTKFTVSPSGAGLSLAPLGSHSDSVALTVAPVCAISDISCSPVSPEGVVVTATHGGSGLSVSIPVHIRYESTGDHGVAAAPVVPRWPMFGLATASVGTVWQREMMHPFVRRTGFGKFDAPGGNAPVGDEPAGAVLSSAYGLWREASPWGASPNDVKVPPTPASKRAGILIKAYYAGASGSFDADKGPFLLALQAGADIVSYTPVGAWVAVDPSGVKGVAEVAWTGDCSALGTSLTGALSPGDLPAKNVLSVYMLAFPASLASTERAVYCGPGTLATSGSLELAHAIVLPQGNALPATVAHEIGHALALEHVSTGSGFFDDNLMVITDDLSAPMRSRLSIGQAFRAALDPKSFIVTSGEARSGAIDCLATPLKCPGIALDAHRRTP